MRGKFLFTVFSVIIPGSLIWYRLCNYTPDVIASKFTFYTRLASIYRGVETILKVEGHDSYEVKNGGPGVYPRKKFCKPRPSNCGEMIPRLVIMLKPNKIPPLKLYIAITFCLITFLLKSPQ